MQVIAADQLNLNPVRFAATNTSGGVIGKMILPQNIRTGVSVSDLKGHEGLALRRTFPHSTVLAVSLGSLGAIQRYVVPWIVPH